MGTAWVQWFASSTSALDCYFALSDQNAVMPAHNYRLSVAGYQPNGNYRDPVTLQQIFPVNSSGTYTFYFLADQELGEFDIFERDLTLVFFPTAYGAVSGAAATLSISPETADERAGAEARNTARLEREIDDLRAQVEALRSAVGRDAP